MYIVLCIILIPFALGILFTVGILLYAVFLQIRFPLDRFYRTRSQQEDFIPYDRIPQRLIKYLLLIEDDAFFSHPGFSGAGIRYAFRINREKKQVVTGGSTITQQLVKNIYFGFRHSYLRKAVELVIAIYAEHSLGKRKILELYMNIIYFGNGVYGIRDAAGFYFSKNVQDLSENQMFILACIPYAPTRGNPIQHPQAFETIRNRRLNSINVRKELSAEEWDRISSHHADCLDPDLRKQDDFTRQYPQEVPLYNERFSLHARGASKRHPGTSRRTEAKS